MKFEEYKYTQFPLMNEKENEQAIKANQKLIQDTGLTAQHLKPLAERFWKQIDTNQDGFLSHKEISNTILDASDTDRSNRTRADVDPLFVGFMSGLTAVSQTLRRPQVGLTEEGRPVHSALIIDNTTAMQRLAAYHKDGDGKDTNTISKKDFADFDFMVQHMDENLNKLSQRIDLLKSLVSRRYELIDKNQDGILSRSELTCALETSPQERTRLEAKNALTCFNAIDCHSTGEDGRLKNAISKEDLNAFISQQSIAHESWAKDNSLIRQVIMQMNCDNHLSDLRQSIESE